MKKPGHPTAPVVSELKRRVTVTHPFHPLRGQEFELLEYRRSWGRECIECRDGEGRFLRLQISWTDAAGEIDPFVAISAGRSYFRVEDLLRLAALIEGLRA
jgi:hypothetical protein